VGTTATVKFTGLGTFPVGRSAPAAYNDLQDAWKDPGLPDVALTLTLPGSLANATGGKQGQARLSNVVTNPLRINRRTQDDWVEIRSLVVPATRR
jgi:hypothetical protein